MDDGSGSEIPIQRVKAVRPTVAELAQYVGDYASEEAESTFTVRMEGDALALTGRPDRSYPLTPLYADAFDSEVGTIVFRRAGDRVTEFSVVQDRVWDLRFRRVPADGAARTDPGIRRLQYLGLDSGRAGLSDHALSPPASAGPASRRRRWVTATRSSRKP